MTAKPTENVAKYRLLESEARPHYVSRSDLRMLSRAYRSGWTQDVPMERQREWVADLTLALGEDKPDHVRNAAMRTYLSILKAEHRKEAEKLRAHCERLRDRIRENARPSSI